MKRNIQESDADKEKNTEGNMEYTETKAPNG